MFISCSFGDFCSECSLFIHVPFGFREIPRKEIIMITLIKRRQLTLFNKNGIFIITMYHSYVYIYIYIISSFFCAQFDVRVGLERIFLIGCVFEVLM